MLHRIGPLLALLAALAFAAPLAGCEEEPRCQEACEHTCDLCDSGCSEGELNTCVQACQDGLTAPERAKCVIDTDLCEDLWQC